MLQQVDRLATGGSGLQRVNDFVVKFANVNGSGSASANALFAKSVLRMGIPATPRNIFPSNIQGLPTWYEVRISEAGHLASRGGGVDLMVAMNPQTWDQDVASIEPGGYLFYDNTKPIPPSRFRDDIVVIGVPLTEMTNAAYDTPRNRQLFKNIVGLGALSMLLDMDPAAIEQLLAEQFKGRDKLIAANVQALHMGRDWVKANLDAPIGLRLRRSDAVGDRIFVEGNSAAALGAVYGGATVCAWYPITPSSSLAEAFTRWCARFRMDKESGTSKFAIVQAEDELASIGMVIGAAWNGSRAFTATSGPGISLMQEFIGLAYFAEIPAVIFDVQRAGPSTGMPTRTQQTDILACAYASHGDTKHVLLFPEDPYECFEFGALAFDLADRLQTPIFVMLDLEIGMNERLCRPFKWDDTRRMDRGKVMTAEDLEAGKKFGRYLDVDNDGIAYRTLPGTHPTKGAFFTRGTSKDRMARYSEEGPDYQENMERLLKKHHTARTLVPPAVLRPARAQAAGSEKVGAIYFGSTSPAMLEADELLSEQGIALDLLRVRGFPFGDEVRDFIESHDLVFVVEQNRDAQLRSLLVNELEINPAKLAKILHYDGTPITARFIAGAIAKRLDVTPESAAAPAAPIRQVVS
jgi:2-oxoglutarate/2-oxoacid ferredoxin oxidoreductase subunit alpha